jgi:hypothetical protein
MPLAQFRNEVARINRTALMPTPKKITDVWAWYKQARRHISEIPDIAQLHRQHFDQFFWSSRITPEVTTRWIRFDLEDAQGLRAYLVIDRTVSNIG